jgi:hypothetical protein
MAVDCPYDVEDGEYDEEDSAHFALRVKRQIKRKDHLIKQHGKTLGIGLPSVYKVTERIRVLKGGD